MTGVTTCAGLALFVAGNLALGGDFGAISPLPAELIRRGPGGWALLMVLVGALGAPALGLAAALILYAGRANAD